MAQAEKLEARPIAGIVLVDKPAGVTSNRVLQRTKRLFQARKAGHTGTLDPIATGMLPICFGAATRVSGLMLEASKRYRVTACFGMATDTGDLSGNVIERRERSPVAEAELRRAMAGLTGQIEQIPPMYSALKHEGRRLYEIARQGREVERKPRPVEIHELKLEALDWPRATLFVHCSKGTYVRTLVTDLAAATGTVAHVESLRRLGVGPFDESQMVGIDELEAAAGDGPENLDRWLLGIDRALVDRPALTLGPDDCLALRQGRAIQTPREVPGPSVRIYEQGGGFVGIGEAGAAGLLRPARIFHV